MALTGLEIFKQLPKTNCRDCGQATCLAFAMAVATGKLALDHCPHLSEAARENLGFATAPPVATIKIGAGGEQLCIGNETVLYRHDKRFENPCAIAISISDTTCNDEITSKIAAIKKLEFDRVGQIHSVDMVLIEESSGSPERYAETVKLIAGNTRHPLILKSENPVAIEKALDMAAVRKPLINGANSTNYEAMTTLAKKFDLPLVVKGSDLNELSLMVEKVMGLGWKEIVLDSGTKDAGKVLADQTQIRRLALRKYRPFGYPTIAYAAGGDHYQSVLDAGVYICKYAGIVVIDSADPADILTLITLRLNIYSDPQKPIAVESKVYEVLTPDPDSPVYITTNFSLTYFGVAGDIEASRVPGYILPVDTDGVSVLTGWAAGKFTPEIISEMLNKSGIADMVSHRKIIIPGGVAVLKERLQEISGWEVLVGPIESSSIPGFIKQHWRA